VNPRFLLSYCIISSLRHNPMKLKSLSFQRCRIARNILGLFLLCFYVRRNLEFPGIALALFKLLVLFDYYTISPSKRTYFIGQTQSGIKIIMYYQKTLRLEEILHAIDIKPKFILQLIYVYVLTFIIHCNYCKFEYCIDSCGSVRLFF
jgi:hypothetical protein